MGNECLYFLLGSESGFLCQFPLPERVEYMRHGKPFLYLAREKVNSIGEKEFCLGTPLLSPW